MTGASDIPPALPHAVAALRRQAYAEAEAAARRAIEVMPGHDGGWRVLARAFEERGDHAEARRTLERGLEAAGRTGPLLLMRAALDAAEGRPADAHAAWDEVLRAEPGHPGAIAAKAEQLERDGRGDEAIALVERLPAGSRTPATSAIVVRMLAAAGRTAEAIAAGETALADPVAKRGGAGLRNLLFSLARVHERAGDADAALARAAAANAILRPAFDPAAFDRLVDRTIEVFSAAGLERMRSAAPPRSSPASDRAAPTPVFVVGLPRCGSTLVERILDAHPRAVGVGEVPDFHQLAESLGPWPDAARDLDPEGAARLGAAYRARIARRIPAERSRPGAIVNKDLGVFWRLGLVDACLPDARVVLVRRADLDHGLAMYLERLRPSSAPWACDLHHCGRALAAADRLARHWRAVLRVPLVEVRYEDFVSGPAAGARRLVEAIGLGWDEACLAPEARDRRDRTLSYEQASRPVHRGSVGRAARFADRLEPLRRGLREGCAGAAADAARSDPPRDRPPR